MKHPLITLGSPIGIGYEVFLLSRIQENPLKYQRITCIGSARIMRYFMQLTGITLPMKIVNNPGDESESSEGENFVLINIDKNETELNNIFNLTPYEDGLIALNSIINAAQSIEKGFYGSMVTLPVSKENINLIDKSFKGHTEYLQTLWQEKTVYMTFISDKLNILLLTTHIPLQQVPGAVTPPTIEQGLRYAHELVKKNGNNRSICLLGLNPHAGEHGLLGSEENYMTPIVEKLNQEGLSITGPIPADTAFTPANIVKYGVFVAHYHDQGLIPFKMLAFDTGVNLSFGMKYIRTSVDHGTAVDLIGKKSARIESFINAFQLAEKLSS